MTDDEVSGTDNPTLQEQFVIALGAALNRMALAEGELQSLKVAPSVQDQLRGSRMELACIADAFQSEAREAGRARDKWRGELVSLLGYVVGHLSERYEGSRSAAGDEGICSPFLDDLRGWCDDFGMTFPFKPEYDDAIPATDELLEVAKQVQSILDDAIGSLDEARSLMRRDADIDSVRNELSEAQRSWDDAYDKLDEYGVGRVTDYLED